MTNYFIVKHGVYLQGVYGPYATYEDAKGVFNKAYKKAKDTDERSDFDGYHSYYIIQGLPEFTGETLYAGDNPSVITCEYEPYKGDYKEAY